MEVIGIALSVPVTFVASALYSLVLKRLASRRLWIRRFFLPVSLSVLTLLLLEFIGVLTVGTLSLRATIGHNFYFVHLVLFLFAVPSLVNMLQLQRGIPLFSKWYVAAFACAIFGLCVVLLQYGVSEALFGIDGTGGPYSSDNQYLLF